LIAQPADGLIISELMNSRLGREGHMTESKVVMIMVDFKVRMETILKEMCKLLGHLHSESGMDLSQFPEVPGTIFMARF